MSNRDFSDTIKLEIIKKNYEKHNGEIHCEICNKKLRSIGDCHFDHIVAYVNGGKSTLSNCQILCVDCNLRKNDKDIDDFVLEERAKRFLAGEKDIDIKDISNDNTASSAEKMTKEIFDKLIGDFIKKRGNIFQVDFGREYNDLPSIHYVRLYYGSLSNMKNAFNIESLPINWDREKIRAALTQYVLTHGDIRQIDMRSSNKLPSIPCVLKHYPELKNFSDIKRSLCNIQVPENWSVETAVAAGKAFLTSNITITQKDLNSSNGLPSSSVIIRLFGSLNNFQKAIGCTETQKNEFVSKRDIESAVEIYFDGRDRIVESRKIFFEGFPYSPSTIEKRYGGFEAFCDELKIKVLKRKKGKYSKQEVDNAILNWVKSGKDIPSKDDLSKSGLPSREVILRFYENWKEPFYFYKKIYDKLK